MKKTALFAAVLMAVTGNVFAVDFPEGECFAPGDTVPVTFKTIKTADRSVRTACINGNDDAIRIKPISIEEDIEVDSVVYNREFPFGGNVVSTIVLPFDFNAACIPNAIFYRALRLADYSNDGHYTLDMSKLDTAGNRVGESDLIQANVPYLVAKTIDAGSIDFGRCYKNESKSHVIKKNNSESNLVNLDGWEFRGTYERIEWNEGHADLGRVYGFAASASESASDTIKLGDFVKVAKGALINPMRAYLRYNYKSRQGKPGVLAKVAADQDSAIVANLPKSITVRVVNETAEGGEDITVIGRMDVNTGEVIVNDNVWFDMKGRVFGRKPSIKGTYYKNGKKVVVK